MCSTSSIRANLGQGRGSHGIISPRPARSPQYAYGTPTPLSMQALLKRLSGTAKVPYQAEVLEPHLEVAMGR